MRRLAIVAALAVAVLLPAVAHAEDPIRVFTSGADGRFLHPRGIAVDANGYVYVADSEPGSLTKLAPDGSVVRVIGRPDAPVDDPGAAGDEDPGGDDEPVDVAVLRDDALATPMGVAVAPDGTLVVAEAGERVRVSRWSPAGAFLGAFSQFGVDPGQLASPAGVAVAADGTVYVADPGSDRVSAFALDGTFLRTIGQGPSGAGLAGLSTPGGVAVDGDGTLWVTDGSWDELKHYAPDGTLLGVLPIDGDPGFQDGALGLAIGPGHVFHVAHTASSLVRRWTDAGVQLAPVGNGEGDEPGETDRPEYVAFDCSGRLYVSDSGNGRVQVFGDAAAPPCGTPDDVLTATLDGAATQRFRQRFAVVVRPGCSARPCTVALAGTIAIQGRRPVPLRPRAVRVDEAGRSLMVEAGSAGARRVVAALQRGRRVTATIDLRAVDQTGAVATARIVVRLR